MAALLTASSSRREPINPPKRNPITQQELEVPEFKSSKKPQVRFEPSPEKKEGIARAVFSEQMKRSFSLAYSEPEQYSFTKKMLCPEPYEIVQYSTSRRKADCTPPPRNPITQDNIPNTPPKVRGKMTESTIFNTEPKKKNSMLGYKQGL